MFLFNIGNAEVLYNLLGTFYFDQENGWTLLERQARLQKLEGEISKLTDVMNNSKRFGDCIETKNVFVNIGDDKR